MAQGHLQTLWEIENSAEQTKNPLFQYFRSATERQGVQGIPQLTSRNNEASKHKNNQQGKRTESSSENLRSPNNSNEPKEGQCHLVHSKERQELSKEPKKKEQICQLNKRLQL